MEKNVQIGILLDIYGKLLTEKQRKLLENEKITRQAVRDNLKKGENNLFEYEEKLEMMKKDKSKKEKIKEIQNEISKIEKSGIENTEKSIQKIKKQLNSL